MQVVKIINFVVKDLCPLPGKFHISNDMLSSCLFQNCQHFLYPGSFFQQSAQDSEIQNETEVKIEVVIITI